MDKKQANKLLNEWKYRLGLYDWRIMLAHECTPDDMPLEKCSGCVTFEESIKVATIYILSEQCYSNKAVPYHFEETLVHELLHLKMSLLSDTSGSLQDRVVHQIIDDLARAFVSAKSNGN